MSKQLEQAIELALRTLPSGPSLGAFGIAREDCALVHIDYVSSIHGAASVLADALAGARGTDAASIHRDHRAPTPPCDCTSCSKEDPQAVRDRYRAGYTNVKEWVA